MTAFSFFYNNNVNFIEFIFKKSHSKKYYTHVWSRVRLQVRNHERHHTPNTPDNYSNPDLIKTSR